MTATKEENAQMVSANATKVLGEMTAVQDMFSMEISKTEMSFAMKDGPGQHVMKNYAISLV
jgi:hypothetical protein